MFPRVPYPIFYETLLMNKSKSKYRRGRKPILKGIIKANNVSRWGGTGVVEMKKNKGRGGEYVREYFCICNYISL